MVIGESFNFSMQSESSLHVSPGLLNEECFLLQKVNAMVIKTASSSTHFSHVFRHAVQTLSISQYGVKYRQLGLLSSQLEPLIPFVNLARFRNFSTPVPKGVFNGGFFSFCVGLALIFKDKAINMMTKRICLVSTFMVNLKL